MIFFTLKNNNRWSSRTDSLINVHGTYYALIKSLIAFRENESDHDAVCMAEGLMQRVQKLEFCFRLYYVKSMLTTTNYLI
jgi:hypothetical protein